MAFTERLVKLVFGGKLNADEWACSLHMSQLAGGTLPALSAIAPVMRTWFESAGTKPNASATLDYIKYNEVSPVTGKYLESANSNELVLVPISFNGSNVRLPAQISAVVSLGTAAERGRGHRGRFYPPAGVSTVQTGGFMTNAEALGMAESARIMIEGLNLLQAGCFVVVWSQLAQAARKVTYVEVGNVLDTQRRRRSALREEYARRPVA